MLRQFVQLPNRVPEEKVRDNRKGELRPRVECRCIRKGRNECLELKRLQELKMI
jgi:hypothetical protein